ncbi:hypothetical protein CVT25_003348 [Psilocybe cyanescens]|uniref:Uncharacterized protein n=1 Tax=Psilocybe cyanescens TaxID=93625 RepID=A0A409X040_PSICY|nr:hypothetical protein CVT25_003348 [Psilocybe cyanescens]
MTKYPITILAYTRGVHWQTKLPKPYHWALFIRTGNSTSTGITHQLHGMPGAFHYDGPEPSSSTAPDPLLLAAKRNEVDIGSVPPDKVDLVAQICSAIPIDQTEDPSDSESGWNCQSWTVSVVQEMKKEGFVDEWITEEYLRGFLKEI